MHALLCFIVYLCVVMLLTALFYYPVFQLIDPVWEVRPGQVFHRLAMVIAALGFWPFLKLLGINNREALGYSLDRGHFLQAFSSGLVIGVMIMTGHAILLILLGARVPFAGDIDLNDILYATLYGLLSGIFVAFIEESFFRGAMHYGMRRSSPMLITTIATALLYAAVHFIHAPLPVGETIIGWQSGWEILATMFYSYENFTAIADSFTALFTAGLFLSLVRERNGNIALCSGIHAGWVLIIKLVKETTSAATDTPAAFLIGSYDNIIGWAAAAVLGTVTLWYWRYGSDNRS